MDGLSIGDQGTRELELLFFLLIHASFIFSLLFFSLSFFLVFFPSYFFGGVGVNFYSFQYSWAVQIVFKGRGRLQLLHLIFIL